MTAIENLKREIERTVRDFPFIKSVHLLDETDAAVKMRLEMDNFTFIQIYQNLNSGTTNFVLIQGLSRIYGRDCIGGKWHRHSAKEPGSHDFSPEGSKIITLNEFLQEVEDFLNNEGLL